MCYNEQLNEYANWIDDATSKEELIETLYDIEEDLLNDNCDCDDEGGKQYTLKR